MLRSSHWAGVEAVGSGGAFWAVFEEIHSVGPPVDTAAGIQGGCGDAQNVWSLTGWGFVPRKAKMTKHCDTFCLGSFKLPWMSGFLFPFFSLTATHLSEASHWGMMRVRASPCATLDSLLIGVHLGSPTAMNAPTPLQSRRHFSAPSWDSFFFYFSCPAAISKVLSLHRQAWTVCCADWSRPF